MVDNASSDGSPEMVSKEFPQVKLIRNKKNAGFAKANNQAIKLAQGDYILLLNPDTKVQADALNQMIAFLDSHPDAGVVGAKLVLPDGRVQPDPFGRFPTVKNILLLKLWQMSERIKGNRDLTRKDFSKILEVDWISGASMMIRQEVIKEVGLMDEEYFLYLEDVDWCYRMRQAGWSIYVLPTAKITHHLGQSRQKNLQTARTEYRNSFQRFCEKHNKKVLLQFSKFLA